MDLFSYGQSQKEQTEPKHLTVSQLNARIKGALEPAFQDVWVQGEVSNLRPATSGHLYFSLKDSGSMISAAFFGWGARKKTFDMKDGLQVICHGRVTLYPPRGSYQITVDRIEPVGAGALQYQFEQLKIKLQAEGLFDQQKKRPLPKFPDRIAVITSPSGAAIQDMLNVLNRRAPQIRVTIIPALVQGPEAAKQVLQGLKIANDHELGEIIVLARGGGSIEDLWSFNDETLARAISKSKIPVISAVGHETDFTISDFVADLRAPTPSAAAEILSGHWVDVIRQMNEAAQRLQSAIRRDLSVKKNLISHVAARLMSPKDRIRIQIQRSDELYARLERSMKVLIDRQLQKVNTLTARLPSPRERIRSQRDRVSEIALRAERAIRMRLDRRFREIESMASKLDALSPLRVLTRGYSITRTADEKKSVVKSVKEIKKGQKLEITFSDGSTTVESI